METPKKVFLNNMKKTVTITIMLTISALCFASCSTTGAKDGYAAEGGDMPETVIQMTDAVPSEFFRSAIQQGTVELLWYDSKDYTRSDQKATRKPAYVYLPYGYDPAQKYDVIYLLHGWTGTAEQYFGISSRPQMKNLFDNMIERGLTKPFIAVSPTWDKDNKAKDWGESTREAAVFSQEYVNDLIPAIETHYSTYLETADEADILASRDHRAIGGFSLGSITTWYIFEQAFSYSRWYLPMSGDNWHEGMYGGQYYPDETARFLADLVNASPYKDDFYIWYAVGTEDVRLLQTHNQAMAMLRCADTFNSNNFSYHQKQGGRHDFNAVLEFIYNALPFFFPPEKDTNQTYYTRKTRISEVINDMVFSGYGRLIFPVNENYWSGTTLEQLDLTWYNYIDPDKTVEVCNYLRNHASDCFIDIYTEAEKQADPEKQNTGMFFFRGIPGQPFAICNAGGGFAYVGAMHDSFPHALELSKQGYNAFALIYRPSRQMAMDDLARAITYIHDHASELGVQADSYSLWGGSAGARMAATLGNFDNLSQLTGRNDIPQAAAVVMQYTGHSVVFTSDAPTYACCGTSDGIASWRTMRDRLENLSALGIPTEFHSYNGLAHGFGLGTGTIAEGWLNDALRFWQLRIDGTPSGI
ncbi:MAG: alpha/beta hydrolase-fold protein [Bacteroidales bacterium]|jgi:acetyl esterase/lipase